PAIDEEGRGTVRFAYDALSRLSRITPPSGAPLKEITYSRDGLGRVTAVGEAAGGSEFGRYVYTANGDLQTETLGGAWTRSFVYQPDGALASVSTKGQGEDGLDMTFGYDADGMMTARDMVFAGGLGERFTDTVEYDAQRRIKSASGSSDAQYGAYDANGNILEATEGGKTSTFTLEKGSDRLASAAIEGAEAASITWTPQGCMAEGLGRTFAYDRASGATTMVTTKAGKTRFAYGGLRQRVVKLGPEGKTVYLHGTGRTPVARSTPRGMEVEVLGPTGLIAVVSDKARFPITDTQGSVWAVADEKGIVATYAYSPFGRLLSSAGPEAGRFAYRWQGREFDPETGLYDFRARLYDPALMRFHAPDPAGQFASPYVFGGNVPLIIIDPTGEISIMTQVGIGIALAAIIVVSLVAVTAITAATAGVGAPEAAVVAGGVDATLAGGVTAADAAAVGTTAAIGAGEAAAAATEVTTEATVSASVEGVVEGTSEGVADGVIEGTSTSTETAAETTEAVSGAAESAETSTGADVSDSPGLLSRFGSNFSFFRSGMNLGTSTMRGAAVNGFTYDVMHNPGNFTWKGFGESVGAGAAGGAASGALGGVLDPAANAIAGESGIFANIGMRAMSGAIAGSIGSDVSRISYNLMLHRPWYQDLLRSTSLGFSSGAIGGAISGGFDQAGAIGQKAVDEGVISAQTVASAKTAVKVLQDAAMSRVAQSVYSGATIAIVTGYVVWAVKTDWK
ncbi:MAG: RHS repeat-associated core domain-containing protein, partial [Pseudomonadota bacterium]